MALERRRLAAVLSLLGLGGGFLLLSILSSDQHPRAARSLTPGSSVKRSLSGGKVHFYRLSIEPGKAFRVTLDPHRHDFTLILADPFQAERLQVDTSHGLHGKETLFAIADLPGDHVLEVHSQSPAGTTVHYELTVDEPKPDKDDRLRAAAMSAFSRGEQLFGLNDEEAGESYAKARELWQGAGEVEWETATRYRLGRSLLNTGEWREAFAILQPALRAVRGRGDRLAEACVLDRIGRSYLSMGNLRKALSTFERSLNLFGEEEYAPGKADALNSVGLVHKRRGDFEKGLKYQIEALDAWKQLGGREEQAILMQNLGELHLGLGESERALDWFRSAVEVSRGQKTGTRVLALRGEGTAYAELRQLDDARPPLEQAVELAREIGDLEGEVSSLIRLGDVHVYASRLEEARALYERALSLSKRKPVNRLGQAMALGNLGHVLDLQHQEREALIVFAEARALFQNLGEPAAVAISLYGSSEVYLDVGDLDAARRSMEGAIGIIETFNSPVPADFTQRRSFYELYVEILMRLYERTSEETYAALAFNAAEAARSRSLLEDVKESQAASRPEDKELLQQKDDISEKLRDWELRRWSAQGDRSDMDPVSREFQTRLELVRSQLAERGLGGSPRPLKLEEVQRSLEPGTVLLAYFLGEKRSFLWEVTSDRFETHKLEGRSEIEKQAKRVRQHLGRFPPPAWRVWASADRELSRTLLSPVAGRLGGRRLLISPDGALYLVPFAALLDPLTLERKGEPGDGPASPRYLVFDHRIVTLPSISVVTAARRALEKRPLAPEAIAVLADPIYSLEGDRKRPRFRRLPQTLQEAKAIEAVAPSGRSFLATGFLASRSTAFSPKMGLYQTLHFAAHGVAEDRPDLSGIALSMFDESGAPQDGFLRAFEIYDLELSCDLVVLSACETALGGDRGGLVRAFLHAGARRVLATQWPVLDRSTAQLMDHFYQGFLRQDLPPADALQQAQVSLLKDRRWKSPHHWGGFLLHGEWK